MAILLILPRHKTRKIVEAISLSFVLFLCEASHAIDPGSNPGQGVLVLKGTSDITACQCLALLSSSVPVASLVGGPGGTG